MVSNYYSNYSDQIKALPDTLVTIVRNLPLINSLILPDSHLHQLQSRKHTIKGLSGAKSSLVSNLQGGLGSNVT